MSNLKKLSRAEMKNVMGGAHPLPIAGKCCGHTADWSAYQCNLSKADAQAWDMWCCQSC